MLDWLHMDPVNQEVTKFFLQMIKMTIKHREDNKIHRNDFMQLFIELREQEKSHGNEMTVEEIAANCILFYNAGTVSTSGSIGYLLYEAALQPDIMKNLQTEIDATLEGNSGELTYDLLQEMVYLDMCVKETLRKYPGLPHLNRECSEDYDLVDGFTVKKGTAIVVSVMGLHYNPQNFENPEKFDPKRFRKGKETYNKDAYMPFGEGPRQCVGKIPLKNSQITIFNEFL